MQYDLKPALILPIEDASGWDKKPARLVNKFYSFSNLHLEMKIKNTP